jgi:uncharacterized lipoprotein
MYFNMMPTIPGKVNFGTRMRGPTKNEMQTDWVMRKHIDRDSLLILLAAH